MSNPDPKPLVPKPQPSPNKTQLVQRGLGQAGIGGEKCDQCDRGFVQNAVNDVNHPVLNRTIPNGQGPDCVACGECFSNWDRILEELREKTENTVGKARRVKVSTKMTIL